MKDIVKRWCESGQLSVEEAYKLITEYLSYTDRTPTPEELQAILQIGQGLVPIDWDKINTTIARHYNCDIIKVETVPDNFGNKRLICRKFYEQK